MAALLEFPTEADKVTPFPQFYYIQDSRHYVGNSVLWWREDVGGDPEEETK